MGMYDNVKCEYKLPGAPKTVQNDTFQTKEFECMLHSYTITEDGQLFCGVYEHYEIPEEERPYYGTPEWYEKPFRKLVGSMGSKFIEDRKIKYHGVISIYTIASNEEWWEYRIKFTNGKIEGIKRVNENWMRRNCHEN